jgi:hypothetical protein
MTRAKGERSEVIMNEIPNVNYEFVSIHHLYSPFLIIF